MPTRPSAPRKSVRPPAMPRTTVDVVIFTVRDQSLRVLLVRRDREPFAGRWALPGGFIDTTIDRDLVACARRKLHEKTGVASPYLEQVGSWGNATRDPRGWSATHVYFALIPSRDLVLVDGSTATTSAWFEIGDLARARLAFDHDLLLRAALDRLRSKAEYTSLPAFLLDEPFTLPQLQGAYETVLGRAIDKSAFRTRMLAADFLEETGPIEGLSNRPALGYRLRDRATPVLFPRTFSPRG